MLQDFWDPQLQVILSEIFVWTLEDMLHCFGIASPTEEQPEPKPLLLTGFIHGKIPACWSSTATFSLSPSVFPFEYEVLPLLLG